MHGKRNAEMGEQFQLFKKSETENQSEMAIPSPSHHKTLLSGGENRTGRYVIFATGVQICMMDAFRGGRRESSNPIFTLTRFMNGS